MYRKELESVYKKDSFMVFECVDKNCVVDVVFGWIGVLLGVCFDGE